MNYNNRTFYIFDISQINLIDFSQVLETSSETLRFSVDGTKTFFKFDGQEPDFLDTLTTKEGPYTYEEMINILSTPLWTKSDMLDS